MEQIFQIIVKKYVYKVKLQLTTKMKFGYDFPISKSMALWKTRPAQRGNKTS